MSYNLMEPSRDRPCPEEIRFFRLPPPLEFIETLIQYYGISNLNDCRVFTKHDLMIFKTKEKIIDELLCDLTLYYYPFKIKEIMRDFSERKAITILKHFLSTIGYKLTAFHTVILGKKVINYKIEQKPVLFQISKNNQKCILTFD